MQIKIVLSKKITKSFLRVILGHTFVLGIAYAGRTLVKFFSNLHKKCDISISHLKDNPQILQSWFKRFTFMVVSNAFFSVDSFFLLRFLF